VYPDRLEVRGIVPIEDIANPKFCSVFKINGNLYREYFGNKKAVIMVSTILTAQNKPPSAAWQSYDIIGKNPLTFSVFFKKYCYLNRILQKL
jgi:hypothetical protein